MDDEALTVGRAAQILGVSVRTLHHWDRIGLAEPTARNWAGYRLYGREDIARLQQVLVYREVGLSLSQIREVIDSPGATERQHLHRQRELLEERIVQLRRMVRAVETLLEEEQMNQERTPEQQAAALAGDWTEHYAAEAEQRWGDSPEWKEAEQKKASMDTSDWKQVQERADALNRELAAAMAEGVSPEDPRAVELVRRHREEIGQWFAVSPAQHVLIARGYTDDPRFQAYYEAYRPGLAAWLREAIEADARNHGVDPEQAAWE